MHAVQLSWMFLCLPFPQVFDKQVLRRHFPGVLGGENPIAIAILIVMEWESIEPPIFDAIRWKTFFE